jgi:hypothetical protein
MKRIIILLSLFLSSFALAIPQKYLDLLPYVIQAPDQGETNTCLFVGSTGAMEIIANKKHNLTYQGFGSQFDISERFLISAPNGPYSRTWYENPVLKFNRGQAIQSKVLPFEAWIDGQINYSVWNYPRDFDNLPRINVPEIETEKLFIKGGKWDTRVLNDDDIKTIKEALVKYNAPVLVNYNDEYYWHVVLIVGYEDGKKGECYDVEDESECRGLGSFFVRDSFGVKFEIRDYDWFKIKGNAAFVVKEKSKGKTKSAQLLEEKYFQDFIELYHPINRN